MLKNLLRSKTRIQLKKVTAAFVCFTMAMPPAALADPPFGGQVGNTGTPGTFDPAAAASQSITAGNQLTQQREEGQIRADNNNAKNLADFQAARAAKFKQAAKMKEEAKAMKNKVIEDLNDALNKLPDHSRRTDLGKLEPVLAPGSSQGSQSGNAATGATTPKTDGTTTPEPPATDGQKIDPAPMQLPRPTTEFKFGFGRTYVFLFVERTAHAGSVSRESMMDAKKAAPVPFDYEKASVRETMTQIGKRSRFISDIGTVSGRLNASVDRIPSFEGKSDDKLNFVEEVRAIEEAHKITPEAAVKVVREHFLKMAEKEAARVANEVEKARADKGNDAATALALANHGATESTNTDLRDRGIGARQENDVSGFTANDLKISVDMVSELLKNAKTGLAAAQKLEDDATSLEQEAKDAQPPPKEKAPTGEGQQQQPQRPPQNAGNGGGGQGGGDKGKGAAGAGGVVPQPGGIADSSKLFGSQPETPSVDAVAANSAIESQPNPKWENVPATTVPPGMLRSTATTPVMPTSGQEAQAGRPFIQGNMSPGSPIDKSMFGGGGGGGEGGGDKPGGMGGGTGGTAGGAFGGDDVGRGIGPSYGGRAGLSDAVKKYETGPGGGSTSSESSAPTIATGAEAGIPQGFANQVSTGKKFKDGAGKGGLGLMGNVSTLLQQQCGDQTQRSKFESFCVNAVSVAAKGRNRKTDPSADQLAFADGPRRDLASDRGVTSSK